MFEIYTMETLLPFILILAVSYGALETAGIFRNKAVRTIISVVLAFFAVSNYQTVQIINSYLPYAAVVFILVFIFGYAKRSLRGDEKDNTLIIIVMALVLLFLASYTQMQGGSFYQYNDFLWLIGVVVVVAILYGAYRMK